MFKLAKKEEIGQYLQSCIEKEFGSQRQFCIKYLENSTGSTEKSEDPVQIRNMTNRLSQIVNGKKEIQLYDLPWFCRLLGVSCEDILSAGKSHVSTSAHLTNYVIAFSKDEGEWATYVEREDSPILNADEYGKTVIDYALEAENYDFLKYLMDRGFIWFVGTNKRDYYAGFGAGTSIEKASFPYPENWNVLDLRLKTRDELRIHMIVLAIQHKDLEMLERLHAREVPSLYLMSYLLSTPYTCTKYYNEKLMDALTHADNEILEYFSKAFELTDELGHANRFLFPFIGELIERLLENKNEFAKYILKEAIWHNQYVYEQLNILMADAVRFYKEIGFDLTNEAIKNDLTKGVLKDLDFYPDGILLSFFALPLRTKKGLRANIIRVNAESEDTSINRLILELNDLHDTIRNITPQF